MRLVPMPRAARAHLLTACCSAEDAMKMLEQERRGLKAASLDQQNLLARTMLATNRFISTRLQETMTVAKKGDKGFRGGIEPIQHVLPPDVQRALHSKLCAAIKQGENQVMTMLLRFDIDLDYSDPFGTPLHYAANFGQLQAAHLLLEKGSFPGAVNYREQTPLHMAASKNASTVVDLLVRYGAPLNATEMGGSTAMHIACTNGFVKVVEILIMGGADCDKPNRIGWSPLHLACLGMHHDVIEKLCISGMCNPNSTCSITKEVRVGKSSYASKFQVVKGDTPGHFAARLAYFMCLKVLLENGGDPCAQNERGETMMHLAVQTADMRCVERILEYGWGFIDLEDHLGRDPIDVCDDKLAEHEGDEPEDVSVRKIVNAMKTLLQRTSVLKNRAAHKELMEQAKRGVGGRKKNLGDAPPAIEEGADEKNLELEETPMDDRTMEEKITAMKIELEASRAEARAAEAQSRMKTYNLNEALLETKRRLVESEFMLERERESRLALEQDVLGLIGAQEEEENEKGRASEYSEQSSRAGTAQGSYEKGKTYESLRLQSAQGDADATWRMQRQSSGMMKKEFGRSFSGTQGVRFAESDPDLDEELEKYERAEASSMRAESLSQEPVRSRAGRETYSGRGAHEIMPVEVWLRQLLCMLLYRFLPCVRPVWQETCVNLTSKHRRRSLKDGRHRTTVRPCLAVGWHATARHWLCMLSLALLA
jgi:ankyrin repeat protein